MDRFSNVPTPPADGSTPNDASADYDVLTGQALTGNGGLWPESSQSTAALRGCDYDDMPDGA